MALLQKENDTYLKFKEDTDIELRIKDTLIERLQSHIKVLQQEITTAKKILRDPNLTRSIGRTYEQIFES